MVEYLAGGDQDERFGLADEGLSTLLLRRGGGELLDCLLRAEEERGGERSLLSFGLRDPLPLCDEEGGGGDLELLLFER